MDIGLSSDETMILQHKAKKRAYLDVCKSLNIEILETKIKSKTIEDPYLKELQDQLNSVKKNHKPKKYIGYFWITVTSKYVSGSGCVHDFVTTLSNLIKLNWIQSLQFNIELTRSEVIHSHMLVQVAKPMAPADVLDRLRRSRIKQHVELKKSKRFIRSSRIPDSWYDDKVSYLRGEKWDEDKTDMIQHDIEFRKKNNLKDFYFFTKNITNATEISEISSETSDAEEEDGTNCYSSD